VLWLLILSLLSFPSSSATYRFGRVTFTCEQVVLDDERMVQVTDSIRQGAKGMLTGQVVDVLLQRLRPLLKNTSTPHVGHAR
jgi:hypothetical protein